MEVFVTKFLNTQQVWETVVFSTFENAYRAVRARGYDLRTVNGSNFWEYVNSHDSSQTAAIVCYKVY